MQRRIASLLLLTLGAPTADAQRQRCGTPEPDRLPANASLAPSDCGYYSNTPQAEYEPSCVYDIPVVFHVLQKTTGEGFLSQATLQDQIDVLNEDFQAIPGTPGAPGTNGRIRFHLANTDPAGNPTSGITYSMDDNWFVDNGNYWSSLAWDTNRYLNIYTNNLPQYFGYVSGFPSQGIAGQNMDRVVIWWEAVGRAPTIGWPLNMGRTGTHEVGHYLGLYHTFCGGCGSPTLCDTTGDLICDTNRESAPAAGCPSSKVSCGSPDPIHNYMNYTDDPCVWKFTPEQVNRTRCTLFNWRPDLGESSAADVGTSYCATTPNSTGLGARISALGDASISRGALTLISKAGPANSLGVFFYGPTRTQAPFGDGLLCVGGRTYRLPRSAPSNTAGVASQRLRFDRSPLNSGSGAALAGSTWNFQYWFDDPNSGSASSFNLTDALSITFCP